MVRPELSIMDLCASTNEIDIFDTRSVQEVIQFKWNTFGWHFHLVGGLFHTFYMAILVIYNTLIYIDGLGRPSDDHGDIKHHIEKGSHDGDLYSLLLALGTVYPALYDFS